MPRKITLESLIRAGAYLAIEQGYFVMKSSDHCSPDLDLDKREQDALVTEILRLMNIKGYKFQSSSTGKFGGGRYPGVQLQFLELNKDEAAYAIFSANLNRSRPMRGKAKGTALPKGRFSVGDTSKFARFWRGAGLTVPRSWSIISDCMGRLKKIIFTAEIQEGEKLVNDSLVPLNVSYQTIVSALEYSDIHLELLEESLKSNNSLIKFEQTSNNSRIKSSNKDSSSGQSYKGLQQYFTSGLIYPSSRLTSNKVTPPPFNELNETSEFNTSKVQEQSIDEWIADYDRGSGDTT
ncbi:MAG: hypothetical protein HWE24_07010 [Oceanospirillaceae bacterium]|nr:hypothetical protein [Oceanospirillaceae bacterium]